MQITVKGLASGRTQTFEIDPLDRSIILMRWLQNNGYSIASSCDGQGVCKKCVIQNEWITCEITVEQFLEKDPSRTVLIAYL